MNIIRTDGFFPGSNGKDKVVYRIFHPEGRPKGILQIAHGMSEHFGRYDGFARYMASQGFMVCGNDHLGHGMTARGREELGYIGSDKGWVHMTDDMFKLTKLIKSGSYEMIEGVSDQNNQGLPYFLLGHSMGSILSCCYITCYGEMIDGVILSGTLGKQPPNFPAGPIVKALQRRKGDKYTSFLPYILAFGNYNRKYDKSEGLIAWISKDREVLKAFKDDPRCNFYYTLNGFWNIHEMISFISRKDWPLEIPKDLPFRILSGEMDPVGNYGKGIKKLHKRLKNAGIKDLETTIYPGLRHEILNEPERSEVFNDILYWMEERI